MRNALQETHLRKPSNLLRVDNEAAISLTQNRKTTEKSEHIDVHYYFVRERYLNAEFAIQHVPSGENVADLLTKALPRPQLEYLRNLALGSV